LQKLSGRAAISEKTQLSYYLKLAIEEKKLEIKPSELKILKLHERMMQWEQQDKIITPEQRGEII